MKGVPMKKVCPRCGATFDCLHDNIASCHCASTHLDPLQRAYLQQNYHDCLCHECLETVKANFYAIDINPHYKKKKDD